MEKFREELPAYLGNFEKLLLENNEGNGYFVGDKVGLHN
jgi:glutathione S-transferase